jgi:hypothetical protein
MLCLDTNCCVAWSILGRKGDVMAWDCIQFKGAFMQLLSDYAEKICAYGVVLRLSLIACKCSMAV